MLCSVQESDCCWEEAIEPGIHGFQTCIHSSQWYECMAFMVLVFEAVPVIDPLNGGVVSTRDQHELDNILTSLIFGT